MTKLSLLLCFTLGAQAVSTPTSGQNRQDQDVLRVYTELVQTDVMVFDRQGRFVNGLKKDDFELRIDGAPKPIDFFERVTAGSADEEAKLAAARGAANQISSKSAAPKPLDRGRPVFFYIDDLHMDPEGTKSTRKLINQFIEKEMGQNDEAAISSASGQIGFLQQLTENRAVLQAALERLQYRPYTVRDIESPGMTEYQALAIDHFDRDVTEFFVDEVLKRNPRMRRDTAEAMVKGRAQGLLKQASFITMNTLAGLESLVRAANQISGRKLVFFISGGFFLDERNSDAVNKLRVITSAAARSGVVIYSMDARGLTIGDSGASNAGQFDPAHRLVSTGGGRDVAATQDGMNALALDTGGRAFFNANSLTDLLSGVIKETSTYYLLAWKPAQENQHSSKFRTIEVKVAGRPELKIQVRRGFFDREPDPAVNKEKKTKQSETSDNTQAAKLKKAVLATYPEREIPVSLQLSYLSTPAGKALLSVNFQVPKEFLSFATANGKDTAVIVVAGGVFNDRGMSGASFGDRLALDVPTIPPVKKIREPAYGYSVVIGPGIYQARIAVQDEKSGRVGSAHAWIEIPNLSAGRFALSSLLLGGREAAGATPTPGVENVGKPAEGSIAHSFSANEYLRFLVFVYNSARAPANSKPDVAIQIQVVRDDEPVLTTPLKKVEADALPDQGGIPYAAEMPLSGLPSGRYTLQVTAVDRVAKTSATQQTHFEIE